MRFCKLLLPLLASTLAFAAQPDRILTAIDSSQTVALPKSLHPQAQPQFDLGAVEPSFQLTYMTLLLAPSPSQQKALDQLLVQQQDPKSPNYHKWLTPAQFADRFGLSRNDLSKVTAWLKSQGFQIIGTGGGRNQVNFSGTAGQVANAFGSEIHRYKEGGEVHIANSTPLMMPAALDGIVRTVLGVHNFNPHPNYRRRGAVASAGPALHTDYFDGNFVFPNFLAPGDIATIYDINSLYSAATPIDGTGQALAIVGQTDVYLGDINDFRTGFGLSKITGCTGNAGGIVTACDSPNFKYVLVGPDTGQTYNCGDLGEADLDIEWSGAVARNAQIIFVNAPVAFDSNCNGISGGGVNASLSTVINPPSGPPLAPVVSMSYGICEAFAQDLETLLQQGNAEGVTILNSSGDVGSATCDRNPVEVGRPFATGAVNGLAVSYPASSPEVTGVGGTAISLANDSYPNPSSFWNTAIGANGGTAVTYIPEIPWQDDEALAQYCHAPASGDTFCSNGTPGWVPLTSTATAEQVQEDIWISQGGGGASNCFTESGSTCTGGFPKPSWQPSVPSAPAGVRDVPDVSLFASPNFPGYIFCTPVNPTTAGSTCAGGITSAVENFGSLVGGTSVSSPVFAGMVALLNQYLMSNGLQSTPGLGNINPMLYKLAATPANKAFHPITSGDNNVYCSPHTPAGQPAGIQCPAAVSPATQGVFGFSAANFDAATHYNLVTGLGSVDVDNLFLAWAATLPGFAVAPSPASVSAVAGQNSNTTTITVTPKNGFNSAVTFSCSGLPTGATCSFNPPSSTTSTVLTVQTLANMAAGSPSFTVIGAGGNLSSATSVTLNLTASGESFTMTPGVSTLSVAPGATSGNAVNLTLASTNGFIVTNGGNQTTVLPLTYTCTITPTASEASCSVSAGTGSVINPTVSVMTTAPTVQLQPPLGRGSRIFYAMLLPGLFGVVFAAGSGKGKRGLRLLSLIAVLGFSTLWLGSCGGSNNNNTQKNPGTPAGNYTVNINATTGGASAITATTSFALTVQ